jgi:hypothetical protein
MWKLTLVMISFAGLGEDGAGAVDGVGESAGVGAVLGVVLTAGVEGVTSGELVGCWLVSWVHADAIRTSPASIAGTTPPFPIPLTTCCGAKCMGRRRTSSADNPRTRG